MAKREAYGVGSFIHAYNRGAGKSTVFFDEPDYDRFVTLLYLSNSSTTLPPSFYREVSALDQALEIDRGETIVDLCCYALMPNHFHLLLREKIAGGLSRYMRRVLTAYTMYLNRKRGRSGCVFQGRFKSRTAHEDRHLRHLAAYIHANPVDLMPRGDASFDETRSFLERYRYSSFPDLLGAARPEARLLAPMAWSLAGESGPFLERVVNFGRSGL